MIALLFLIGSAFIGIKIVNLSLGNILNKIEQCLFGIVIGWMTSTVCTYGIAYGFGRLSFNSMLALTVFIVPAVVAVWLPVIRQLDKKILKTYFKYDHLYPLLLLFAPLYYYFFSIRMFLPEADGLSSGGNSWNDMSLHLAISSAFLSGDNFPPMFSVYAGEPLRYPFMPDFQTAILRALRLSPYSALMLTAVPLALTTTGIFIVSPCGLFVHKPRRLWRPFCFYSTAVSDSYIFSKTDEKAASDSANFGTRCRRTTPICGSRKFIGRTLSLIVFCRKERAFTVFQSR